MKKSKPLYETAVMQTLNQHVSVRSFKDKPVSDEMLNAALNAARRSPTSSNMQTYSIIVVRDQEMKKKLSVLAGGQRHVADCPVFIGFLADTNRVSVACQMHDQTLTDSLEMTLVSTVDATLVGMSVQTAVESFGLGAVMVGGMRNKPQAVADLLQFPSGVYMVFGMSLGWPTEDAVSGALKPRLPEPLVIHRELYSQDDPRPLIKEHDAELAVHYGNQNRNQHPAAWSGFIAKSLSSPSRSDLRPTLEGMGFRFD